MFSLFFLEGVRPSTDDGETAVVIEVIDEKIPPYSFSCH